VALPAGVLANRSRSAVFLCWHSVADDGPPYLSVPVARFERQLALLAARGYAGGTSAALAGLLDGPRPDRPLAFLTFDDGFADNHDAALPLLAEHGLTAMVFVIPPLVDAAAPLAWPEVEHLRAAHPRVMRSMDWRQVEALAEAGHEIGAHTLTHPHLDRLGREALAQELLDGRRAVADRLGRCDTIAYPFGDWSPDVARAARAAGYRFAFTIPKQGQRGASRLSIPRIPVDHRDDERRLTRKLHPAARALLLSPHARRAAALAR